MLELVRRKPTGIESLNIYFCRMGWQQTQKLIDGLVGSTLRTLSLVKVSLNENIMPQLEQLVDRCKRLVHLDVSWNQLMPKAMKGLLTVIAANRRM